MSNITIYPQHTYHDDAVICADRRGLLQLAAACIWAAIKGRTTFQPFSHDGEGFDLSLVVNTEGHGSQYVEPYPGAEVTCGIDVAAKLRLGAYKNWTPKKVAKNDKDAAPLIAALIPEKKDES